MQKEVITQNDALLMDEDYARLAEFFEITDRAERLDKLEALKEVREWAKEKANSEEMIDMLLHIRSTERTLLGDATEPRLTKLRRYIALSKEQEQIDKELQLLKGTNEQSG